jgi:hypothetical protein
MPFVGAYMKPVCRHGRAVWAGGLPHLWLISAHEILTPRHPPPPPQATLVTDHTCQW